MFTAGLAHRAALGAIFSIIALSVLAQPVPRSDWKVGDTWTVGITANAGIGGTTRREEVRVVKEAGETGYQVENVVKGGSSPPPAPEMLVLSRDHNFMSPTGSGGAMQEFKWLQWPLEVGRSYQFDVNFQEQVQTWKGKAVAWEEVEVPAGKFKALRLEYERSGSNRNAASETIWYAPDAKVVVKRIQARPGGQRSRDITTTELLAYKFN
jgi:hypothetical protein